MRRFFIDRPLAVGEEMDLPAELAQRLHRVLRLRTGEHIVLVNGGSQEFESEIISLGSHGGTARVLAAQPALAEPRVQVTLYQALIRENRFELVLEKATELGVAAIVPVLAARTVVRTDERSSARRERWRRILIEAAEQSERAGPPTLGEPIDLQTALGSAAGAIILPWEEERDRTLNQALASLPGDTTAVSLFIGPEGGYEDAEVAQAKESGAAVVTMGRRVLRSSF